MKTLHLAALLLAGSAPAVEAQVTSWRIVKGPGYEQTQADTQPTTPTWHSIFAVVETLNPGDATSITLTGGGIVGSLSYDQEGTFWSLEKDYADDAAMDAEFPSATTYTITLSGGALGTLVQQAPLGPEQYAATPYVTGTVFDDAQAYDATAPFTISVNHPGPLTQNSGSTGYEVWDVATDETAFFQIGPGATTSAVVPAHSLLGSGQYGGFVEFTNAALISGAGGFGVSGDTSHNVAVDFPISTTSDGCQTDLGSQGPGSAFLAVCGEGLDSGQTSYVTLTGAPAFVPVYLLVSLPGGLDLAAKGGTLLSVTNLLPGFPLVVPTGEYGSLQFPVPGGSGPITVIAQGVVTDAGQPFGFAITNAVSMAFGP